MVTAAAAPYYTLFVSASRRSFWALESHRTTRSRNAAKHWLRCLPPQMRTDRTVFSHSNPTASSLHQRAGPPASRLQPHLRTATAWSGDREPDEPCGREQERAPGAASSNCRAGGSRSRTSCSSILSARAAREPAPRPLFKLRSGDLFFGSNCLSCQWYAKLIRGHCFH
jgi:hypothetical protein